MSMTKRDRYVVNILDNHIKCATVQQINMLPCFGKASTVANRRLKMLKDNGHINRQMFEIVGNSYVYYSSFLAHPPKELEHSLVMTDVYLALLRTGYEIITFNIETSLKYFYDGKDRYIIPDIMIVVKDPKGRIQKYFCEICLDRKFDDIIAKYNKYKYYYIPKLNKNRATAAYDLLTISPVHRDIAEGYCIKDDLISIESFFKTMSI